METLRQPRPDETRWFVCVQGTTLGPYRAAEVLGGISAGDFLATDRVFTAKEGWTPLDTHPRFGSATEFAGRKRLRAIPVLESPRILRMKQPIAIPKAPEEAVAVAESVSVSVSEPEVAPVAPPAPVIELAPSPAPAPPLPEAAPIVVAAPKFEVKEELELPLKSAPLPQAIPEIEIRGEDAFAELALLSLALEKSVDEEEKAAKGEPSFTNSATATATATEASIPERPDLKPVFLKDPMAAYGEPEIATKSASPKGVIRIELKLPENPRRLLAGILLVASLAASAGYLARPATQNKTRDLKDSHLSDPSSPTTQPQETGDPIPSLQAPTRPQRE